MATLYIASTETFVGKSAMCLGLLDHARRDGLRVGYMKPVSVAVVQTETSVIDEDAAFIRQYVGLSESLQQIAPVIVSQSVVEQIMRGTKIDYTKRLRDAYTKVARGKDLIVLEGANTWAEGSIVNLSADQVSDMLQAPVLMIVHYRSVLVLDAILAAQRYLGDRLIGVLINHVEEAKLEFVRSRVAPFLEQHGVAVFAVLPADAQLAGVTVADLHEFLGGQLIGPVEWGSKLIERLVIGAMGPESALSHFRRVMHKAVITGGDRTDIQMAALQTSTSALVLTGNLRPADAVVDRAEEGQVPIILVADDTMVTVDRAEKIFGHIRFKQVAKIQRFTELLDQRFDFERLYDKLGLPSN